MLFVVYFDVPIISIGLNKFYVEIIMAINLVFC